MHLSGVNFGLQTMLPMFLGRPRSCQEVYILQSSDLYVNLFLKLHSMHFILDFILVLQQSVARTARRACVKL